VIWARQGRLQVAGYGLEYACWGPPPQDAPTLVLLHEGLGSVALWRDLPKLLAAATGWGVLAYARPGYGTSDPTPLPWPLDYMERHAADLLPEIVADLPRFALLGHSDGASIAALYAGRHADDRLRGVGLIAPHFFTEEIGLRAIADARAAFLDGDLRVRLAKYHAHVDCAFWGWNGSWLDPDFADWNITSALRGIEVPVLTLQGDADPYGSLAQVRIVREMLAPRVTEHIFPKARHAPHLEAPEAVVRVVGDWIKEL